MIFNICCLVKKKEKYMRISEIIYLVSQNEKVGKESPET